jgi:hypothetical protein
MMMRVTDIKLKQQENVVELSGFIDQFHLWFRFPSSHRVERLRGDAFLAASLLPAMLRGEPLDIEETAPVSPKLLMEVSHLQRIFHSWNPVFKIIQVTAKTAPAAARNDGVASFFSAGVDSSYTFLKNKEAITHLVFIRGFDFDVKDEALWDDIAVAHQAFASSFGKALIPVATNVNHLAYPFTDLGWGSYHGSALAAVGLALSFPVVYVPATHTYYELFPWGSHPMTDELWSTEGTRFIHDGAEASRCDKMSHIVSDQNILRRLHVCWEEKDDNCGRCSKCLRTMIAMRLLRVQGQRLPELRALRPVRRLNISGVSELTYFEDNYRLAVSVKDRAMASALRTCIRRYHRSQLFKQIDNQVTRGLLRRAYVSFSKHARGINPDMHARRIDF